jgi:hypothetical protein
MAASPPIAETFVLADERLTLLGQDAADLPAISALLQDATLRAPDVAFDRRRRRLVLLVNRYRWEAATPSRVRAALRVETVGAVQRRLWPSEHDAVLAVLALTLEGNHLVISFSGGAALRAQIEVVELVLEDMAPPWRTPHQPQHPV